MNKSVMSETKKRELFYRYFDYFPLLVKGDVSSISDLAKTLKRHDRQVSKELKTLEEIGYVKLETTSKKGTKGYRVKPSLTDVGREELRRFEDSMKSIPVKIKKEDSEQLNGAIEKFLASRNENARFLAIQGINGRILDLTGKERKLIWEDELILGKFVNGFLVNLNGHERRTRQTFNGILRRLYEHGYYDIENFIKILDYYDKHGIDEKDGSKLNEVNESIAIMIIAMDKHPECSQEIYPFFMKMLKRVMFVEGQFIFAINRERERIVRLPIEIRKQMSSDIFELVNELPENGKGKESTLLEQLNEILMVDWRLS